MQLKTCTNPDRIMKYRHKILHSMEIAFSHVLWFEKKRENDSETDGDTRGEEKERGKKERDRDARGESAAARWSPTELRRGSSRARGRRLVFSLPHLPRLGLGVCRWSALGFWGSYLGKKEARRPLPRHPNLGVWGFFLYIYLYILNINICIFSVTCNFFFKRLTTDGILLNNKKEQTITVYSNWMDFKTFH